MSFSTLVSDISFRDSNPTERPTASQKPSYARSTRSFASTAATSVSISGDISSQLHGGYGHSLTRQWQAERQLTKVRWSILLPFNFPSSLFPFPILSDSQANISHSLPLPVHAHLPSLHNRLSRRRNPAPLPPRPVSSRAKQPLRSPRSSNPQRVAERNPLWRAPRGRHKRRSRHIRRRPFRARNPSHPPPTPAFPLPLSRRGRLSLRIHLARPLRDFER